MLIGPALDYMEDQSFIETPALGWPDSIRAAAVPVGCGLMLVAVRAAPAAASGCATCWRAARCSARSRPGCWLLGGPIAGRIGNWNLLVFFVLLLGAGVLIGVPIAFAFGLATVGYLLTTTSTPLR